PGVTTARMLEEMMNGYERALAGRFGGKAEKDHRPKLIREILDRAVHRKWRQLAEERIENVKPTIPLGKRFWALTKKERKALTQLLNSDVARQLITALKGRHGDGKIEVLDAAYWMKGCSSLGRLRYAALVGVADGEPRANNLCLVDIKEGGLNRRVADLIDAEEGRRAMARPCGWSSHSRNVRQAVTTRPASAAAVSNFSASHWSRARCTAVRS